MIEAELVRLYAHRMALVYADKASDAQLTELSEEFLKHLKDKRDFWQKVVQLPLDSEYWASVSRYVNFMSDPLASRHRRKILYRFLLEAI